MTASTKSQRITKEPFRREPRYLVVKFTDANKHLTPNERDVLERMSAKCGLGRINEGKRNLNCVVVESDWPEYEPTWKAIEARMTEASPAPSKETIAKETANEATRALFPHLFTGLSDDTVELVRWQSRLEPIILRALDRAGEAKGADAIIKELTDKISTLEAVRLAALEAIGVHVGAIPQSHIDNKRLEHAYVLSAHRILASASPVDPLHAIDPAPRPPASVDAGTTRTCPVCNNDGFWVDVQPNRHTGDAEQVQVECEFCAMRNERDLTVARIEEATAQLSSLAVQLEEAKKERDEFVGTMNELSMALLNKKAECARIRESLDGFALSAMDGNGEIGRLKAAIEMLNRDKTEMAEHFDEALIERDAHWTGEYKEAHRQISALRSALAEKEKDYAKLCQANVGLADGAIESLQGVRTLRARLAALEEDKRRQREQAHLHVIALLPMAKGYASANPVGNNWKMCEEAGAWLVEELK